MKGRAKKSVREENVVATSALRLSYLMIKVMIVELLSFPEGASKAAATSPSLKQAQTSS